MLALLSRRSVGLSMMFADKAVLDSKALGNSRASLLLSWKEPSGMNSFPMKLGLSPKIYLKL